MSRLVFDLHVERLADRRWPSITATQERSKPAARWIKTGLPWVVVLGISTGVALAMNVAAARALPEHRLSDALSTDAQEVRNLCALHVDGPLYAFVPAAEARTYYDRVCRSTAN